VTAIDSAAPLKKTPGKIMFRWNYILLPLLALWVTIAMVGAFYVKLPPEIIYRFSGVAAANEAGRGVFLAWILGFQVFFTLVALVIVLLATRVARRMQLAASRALDTLFGVMGNMVALPQVIILYAMADIFDYNINGKNLPAVWIFGLAALFAGGVIMAVFFGKAVMMARKPQEKNTSGSKSDVRK
jgi:hypothetical protein